jgi:undecaprenyl-diphosphatase
MRLYTDRSMIESVLAADAALRDWIVQFNAPAVDAVMWWFSAIGYFGGVWAVIAMVMAAWAPRLRPIAVQVVVALLLTHGVVDFAVKPFVKRPRPFVTTITSRVVGHYRPPTYSFPSGHAALSFASATVLAFGVPRLKIVWFVLAALIAFSRVYIGVHYPLDVTCGALLGAGVGVLVSGGRAWYSRGSSLAALDVPR